MNGADHQRIRLLAFVHHRLRLLVFPARTCDVHPQAERETSRFPPKSFRTCQSSPTTPGRASARGNAPARVAFRVVDRVGSRVNPVFAAQWLAYALPYRRFAVILAERRRTARGRCGSLLLHRDGLSLPTLRRFRRRTDNLDENAYCLIHKCSRGSRGTPPLPHLNAPKHFVSKYS